MNVHAAALAKAHRFDEQTSAFASDVIDGLSQHPNRLSPKYFYDVHGFGAVRTDHAAAGNITRRAPNLRSCVTGPARYRLTSLTAQRWWNSAQARPRRSGCCSTNARFAPTCP